MNPFLFPPALFKRAFDDLAAIADAARMLTDLEGQVLGRVERFGTEAFERLDRMIAEVGGLREELGPIRDLTAVRAAIEPLSGKLDAMQEQLQALRGDVEPIQQLRQVREGIEPLDDDMRAVRDSVDELEPLIRQMNTRLAALDQRIETMRADLAPLGELADRVPGIGR